MEMFSNIEKWDKFFTEIGENPYELYTVDWQQLRHLLTKCLVSISRNTTIFPPRILVPGCGISRLSEHLYDAGYPIITNVDFSTVAINAMRRRNRRERPEMKWLLMDMVRMKFNDEEFEAIIDKGGLDMLLKYENGIKIGTRYLKEVNRLLNVGGIYICVTSAESRALDVLLSAFRFGWKTSLHTIAPDKESFVVVFQKNHSMTMSDVSSLDNHLVGFHCNQADKVYEALAKEKQIRAKYSPSTEACYTIQDLKLGGRGSIRHYAPGRRIKLSLGGLGVSDSFHEAILLDAKKDSGHFIHPYAIYLVPHLRSCEWLFTSEEGQWRIVDDSKAARLLMVFLDSNSSKDDIQMDLPPLASHLAPKYRWGKAGGGPLKELKTVCEVKSDLTGQVIKVDEYVDCIGHKYRRLTLGDDNAVLLTAQLSSEAEQASIDQNDLLGCMYHYGIILGTMLMGRFFLPEDYHVGAPKIVILGLGTGLLAMFMNRISHLKIEVVELDPIILAVANECFGFEENEHLKVYIDDGIKFVKKLASSKVRGEKINLLVVDVASSTTSSGVRFPDERCVEKSFILAAFKSLSDQGLFIMNLVTSCSLVKEGVHSRLKEVFSNILCLKLDSLDGDESEVIFALKTDVPMNEEKLFVARNQLEDDLQHEEGPWASLVIALSKSVELLKD